MLHDNDLRVLVWIAVVCVSQAVLSIYFFQAARVENLETDAKIALWKTRGKDVLLSNLIVFTQKKKKAGSSVFTVRALTCEIKSGETCCCSDPSDPGCSCKDGRWK